MPGGDRLGGEPVAVDPAAVVHDADVDRVAALARRDRQHAGLALARGEAVGRRLDAVVDRVADDVQQRVADQLDHLAVELDLAVLELDEDLLAELGRKVAHQPREGREQALDAAHAGAGDRVAHFGDQAREARERRLEPGFGADGLHPPREVVAREDHFRDAAHHLVDQLDRQADRALLGRRSRRARTRRRSAAIGRLALVERAVERGDQHVVGGFGQRLAALDLGDHHADAVDHREHRVDQPAVGLAAAGAHVGERVLGGVAQRLELREIEEPAVAFDGVDEAEDRIEPRAVGRVGFPGDDLARERGQHLARFGDEFRQQIVHCARPQTPGPAAMAASVVKRRLRIRARDQPREICVSCSVMNSTSAGWPASVAAIARRSAGTISAASVTRSPWQPSERANAA